MLTKRFFSLVLFFVFVPLAFGQDSSTTPAPSPRKLVPPAHGGIPVAFVVSEDAVMIDFAGPWEVFQDVMMPSRGSSMEDQHLFSLYTVSDSRKPIRVSGGMQIIPDYTFADAPKPRVVVVPAQSGQSPQMLEWLRAMAARSDVVMSVCTGAFRLAQAGLLDGKSATTHHASYRRLQDQFSNVRVLRDRRYVQSDAVVFTSGGLSSGIDLALHIVDLYFGRQVAADTARQMEYEGPGWASDGTSSVRYSEPNPAIYAPHPSDNYSSGVFGNWVGKISNDNGTFAVAVHLWPDKDGKLVGTLDSIDDDVFGLSMEAITFKSPNLHSEVPGVMGTLDGKLNVQETVIEGIWNQHGQSLPVILQRAKKK